MQTEGKNGVDVGTRLIFGPKTTLFVLLKYLIFMGQLSVYIPSTVDASRLVTRPSCLCSGLALITTITDIVPYHAHYAHCTHPTSSIEPLLSTTFTFLDFGMSS